jgi:hypothetical protein
LVNYFIVPAIAKSIVEGRNNDDEEAQDLKNMQFPYNLMVIANALTWLALSICFSLLGFLIWKSITFKEDEMMVAGFLMPLILFLSNAFQGHYVMFPMCLGIATMTFMILGSLISETPTDIPINLDTSVKLSMIIPHHKNPKVIKEGGQVSKEVKVFQLVNLIMIAVSISMPSILAISL